MSDCAATPALCTQAPDGSYVDHVPAAGGCNAAGNACESGLMPVAQRCTRPAGTCEAGVQHTFALACTLGVGCSVSDTPVACTSRANECVEDTAGETWNTYAPGCEGNVCAPNGVRIGSTRCASGGAYECATQGNVVGRRAPVGACDPVAGCSSMPGPFEPCPGMATTSCAADGSVVTTTPTCNAGVCGTSTTPSTCPGETTRTCVEGVEGPDEVVIRGPRCSGGACATVELGREPCTGEASSACESNHAITRAPVCAAGACTTAIVEDDDCNGPTTYVCEGGYRSSVIPTCSEDDGVYCGTVTGSAEYCEAGCDAAGNCNTCTCDNVTRCEGNNLVVRAGACTSDGSCVASGGAQISSTPCPTGQTCQGAACRANLCAGVSCDRTICDGTLQQKQTGTCDPATGACGTWVNAASDDCADNYEPNFMCIRPDAGAAYTTYIEGICVEGQCRSMQRMESGCAE